MEINIKDNVVTIDGIKYVPEIKEEPKPKIKVGDFVKIVYCTEPTLIGKFGKMVARHNDNVDDSCGVEFIEYKSFLHSLDGRTKDGHGWWVSECFLELVK